MQSNVLNKIIFVSTATLLVCFGGGPASASSIAVYGTGVSVTAGRDNNYQIVADTTGESAPPTAAFVVTKLDPAWASAVAGTKWIGPHFDQSAGTRPNNCCGGYVTYLTVFDLGILDSNTARLNIRMSADDGASIWLNGKNVFTPPAGLQGYRPGNISVLISTDFVPGVNDLEFETPNFVGGSGLDVAITGTALSLNSALVPEPSAAPVLVLLSVIGIALVVIRKRREALRSA